MVKKQQAQADKAYDIQTNVMLQQVRAEEVTIEQVQRSTRSRCRTPKSSVASVSLNATVLKPAEAERQRIETLAEAEKQRLIRKRRARLGHPRAQGEAEAEIIFKKGEAEAGP